MTTNNNHAASAVHRYQGFALMALSTNSKQNNTYMQHYSVTTNNLQAYAEY